VEQKEHYISGQIPMIPVHDILLPFEYKGGKEEVGA